MVDGRAFDGGQESGSARPVSRAVIGVGGAAGAVAIAMVVGSRLVLVLPPGYVVSVFLVAILAAAAIFGLWSGIGAAIASFFAFNYFFVEPTFTFDVANPREVFALGVFLAAAVTTGGLAGRLREAADEARQRADTLAILHDFAQRVAATTDIADIRALVIGRIAACIDGRVVLVDRCCGEEVCEGWPEAIILTPTERSAVEHSFESGRVVAEPSARFAFRPLVTADGIVAVVGLAPRSGARLVAPETERALSALIDQAASALERAHFALDRSSAQAAAEQERLRSVLLSSISHDLRTPLATILGSVTSLRELGDEMEPGDRADLLLAIEEETGRLSRFVADLLAMTRLEAGLEVRRDWVDVGDVIGAAAEHLRRVHPRHPIAVRLDAPGASVLSDAILLEQVVFNLGDNAAKASAPGAPIELAVASEGDGLVVTITDHGKGLSPEALRRLFVEAQPRSVPLSPEAHGGLGLAIARRVVAAMGGAMGAQSPTPDGEGTRVALTLPITPGPITPGPVPRGPIISGPVPLGAVADPVETVKS